MDNFCFICGLNNDVAHDCLTELMRDFKKLAIPTFLTLEHSEEEYITMRQELKPLVDKVDKLRIRRQNASAKFKRLEGEAEEKLHGLRTDLKEVTNRLLKTLED